MSIDYTSMEPDIIEGSPEDPNMGQNEDQDPLAWLGAIDEPDTDYTPTVDIDPSFVGNKARKPQATKYTKKANSLLSALTIITATKPEFIADSAALIMHQPTVATAFGDLAAADERIAKGIDFLTEGVENPYIAALVAVLPLAMQVIRNHEPVFEPKPRGLKIPFTKINIRIPIRIGIRLGIVRAATNDPTDLSTQVFTNAKVIQKFETLGVPVAFTAGNGRRSNR